jgi:pyridoxine 5-phosphate synthase
MAAGVCESAGADSIVVHLREDRRHIQDADVRLLRQKVRTKLNLEMSVAPGIVDIAAKIKPDQSTIVPEKRQELTTEGGLDVVRMSRKVGRAVEKLQKAGIEVSLFIEPDERQIKESRAIGVEMIELHTGRYANSRNKKEYKSRLLRLKKAAEYAQGLGIVVNAGHGLDYQNTPLILNIKGLYELNIGYSIICHALFVGLKEAVSEMKRLIVQ